jgi:hypothetical protein
MLAGFCALALGLIALYQNISVRKWRRAALMLDAMAARDHEARIATLHALGEAIHAAKRGDRTALLDALRRANGGEP